MGKGDSGRGARTPSITNFWLRHCDDVINDVTVIRPGSTIRPYTYRTGNIGEEEAFYIKIITTSPL